MRAILRCFASASIGPVQCTRQIFVNRRVSGPVPAIRSAMDLMYSGPEVGAQRNISRGIYCARSPWHL